MTWPTSQDYNEAVQTPAQCFADAELRQAEAAANALGLPIVYSGNFADVYALESGPKKWAVKCFTRQIPGIRERYAEISAYLAQVQLPFMVEFQFLEQGIRIRGQWYPILKMQWVEGKTLNTFVRENLDKPQLLQLLCQIWARMATRLREANLAHGDLQHGNVLLVQGSKAGSVAIKLVDYDGMCVPALEVLKGNEVGHPAYQHPQRLREGTFGLHVDRFSILAVYTALRALAVGGRPLWEKFDNGDNLLFKQPDFASPGTSPLFAELSRMSDPAVRKMGQALGQAASKPIDHVPLLDDLVERPKTAVPTGGAAPTIPAAKEEPFAAVEATGRPSRSRGKKKSNGLIFAGIAAVGVLLLAAGIAFVATQKPADKSSPLAVALPTPTKAATKPAFSSERKLPTQSTAKVEPKTEPDPKPDPTPDPKPNPEPKPEPTPEQKKPISNSIGMKLAYIPSGTFRMLLAGKLTAEEMRGAPLSPDHPPESQEVKIPEPFHMGVYEVTQKQYQEVMGRNPRNSLARTGEGPNTLSSR